MNPPGSDVAFVFVPISIGVNAKLLATKNVSIGKNFAQFGRFFIEYL